MRDLRALARALGGEVSRNQVLAPAMGHSRRDRSLSIRLDLRAPNGFLVHCFGAGDPLAEKDRVRRIIGNAPNRMVASPALYDASDAERTARALTIWHEADDPRGTPAQAYLQQRGLDLPEEAAGEAIRFRPDCPFAGERTPAMVCLVRDVVTNEPRAIHRTALNRNGQKVQVGGKDRLALGPVGGGAIKLTQDENVTLCLGVGEGIESALSLRRLPAFGPSPVWSLISAGGISALPVLPGIESLWIAVDHDEAGLRSARSTAQRWQAAGVEAFLITPSAPRADLNDIITGHRHG
jgi:putative DNA primase/helicase